MARPVDEDAPPHPVSHYGRSKLEGERVVRELKPDAVIVRPPVVYGPRDTGRLPHSEIDLAGMVRRDRRRRPLVQRHLRGRSGRWADPRRRGGRSRRRTNLLPGASPAELVGQFGFGRRPHHGCEGAPRARASARWPMPPAIAPKSGRTSRAGRVSFRATRLRKRGAAYWLCDSRRAAAELGWEAATPLEAGLARTLAWYKEAGWIRY